MKDKIKVGFRGNLSFCEAFLREPRDCRYLNFPDFAKSKSCEPSHCSTRKTRREGSLGNGTRSSEESNITAGENP
jgi:hypothetical protein